MNSTNPACRLDKRCTGVWLMYLWLLPISQWEHSEPELFWEVDGHNVSMGNRGSSCGASRQDVRMCPVFGHHRDRLDRSWLPVKDTKSSPPDSVQILTLCSAGICSISVVSNIQIFICICQDIMQQRVKEVRGLQIFWVEWEYIFAFVWIKPFYAGLGIKHTCSLHQCWGSYFKIATSYIYFKVVELQSS